MIIISPVSVTFSFYEFVSDTVRVPNWLQNVVLVFLQ